MAKLALNAGDAFMPEYWPANKLIGILEHVLVEAKDIIGKLTSDQIESLAAEKITGQLTDEQLKEIAAAKIAGELTSAQIKELEAAKISGQLVDSQLKEITAGKIKGLLSAAQIESLQATQITGQLASAQIKELEAAKIAGQISKAQIAAEAISTEKLAVFAVTAGKIAVEAITAEKIAVGTVTANKLAVSSITAEKIAAEAVEATKIAALAITTAKLAVKAVTAEKIEANAVTAEKILAEAVTATKIAAGAVSATKIAAEAITAEKLAVGSVTAAKIAVEKLSALSANLGTVTAGSISFTPNEASGETERSIRWSEAGKEKGRLEAYKEGESRITLLRATENGGTTGRYSEIELESRPGDEESNVTVRAGKIGGLQGAVRIISENSKSSFLQLVGALAARRVNFGKTKIETGAEAQGWYANVKHGLPNAPTAVIAVDATGTFQRIVSTDQYLAETFRAGVYRSDGAKTKTAEIAWIAIG